MPVAVTAMGARDILIAAFRQIVEALQQPLTITYKRRSFRGPAWAVLTAYGMRPAFLVLVAALAVVIQMLRPDLSINQLLQFARVILLSP